MNQIVNDAGRLLTDDEFFEIYRPTAAPDSDDGSSYMLDYKDVEGAPVNNVWTIVEGDDDGLYAFPGFHRVNRVGYVLTESPWITGAEQAVWSPPID